MSKTETTTYYWFDDGKICSGPIAPPGLCTNSSHLHI